MPEHNLADKIRIVQSKIKPIVKDSENPYFKSKYFDINKILAELKPLLVEQELTVIQPLTTLDGKIALSTIISYKSEKQEFTCVLPENPDPQKMGSTITYFRRYALQSLFLLEAEDDDANLASQTQRPVQQTRQSVTNKPLSRNTQGDEIPFN